MLPSGWEAWKGQEVLWGQGQVTQQLGANPPQIEPTDELKHFVFVRSCSVGLQGLQVEAVQIGGRVTDDLVAFSIRHSIQDFAQHFA